MKEGAPGGIARAEKAPRLPGIEELREYGNQYQRILQSAIGYTHIEDAETDSYPPELRKFFEVATSYRAEQEELMRRAPMTARELLCQTTLVKSDSSNILAEESRYRLEKLSDGMYVIFADPEFMQELRPGSAAVAYRGTGKHFLFVKEFDNPEYQKRNIAENIPHEAHHLLWLAAQKANVFTSTETDVHYQASFKTFQDELVARASSGGALGGYHHINKLSEAQRQELEKEAPGHADAIIQRVSGLNRLLLEIQYLLQESTVFAHSDLLKPVITATSFDQLEQHLLDMKELLQAHTPSEGDKHTDWDTV